MKSFALALTVGAVSAITSSELNYINHLAKFGRDIGERSEFEARLARFTEMDNEIVAHNSQNGSFTLGHNQFSDWTHEEYKAILGYKKEGDHRMDIGRGMKKPVKKFDTSRNSASEVNWVTAGAVTPVKNQGSCGSCWAFSTTGSLEGAHFVANGELLSFSEQQLVDCAYGTTYGSYGCQGGQPTGAMHYYQYYQADLETTYPYTSGTSTA